MNKLIITLIASAVLPLFAALGSPVFAGIMCLLLISLAAYESRGPATTITGEVKHDHRHYHAIEVNHHIGVEVIARDGLRPEEQPERAVTWQ